MPIVKSKVKFQKSYSLNKKVMVVTRLKGVPTPKKVLFLFDQSPAEADLNM